MRALLDVNMLLALFDPAHVFHSKARAWWVANQAEGWASCGITENGFLRIVSHKSYANTVPLADALALIKRWAVAPRHAFWTDDVSILDTACFDHTRLLSPKQITDVALLALAARHGGRLVTLDRGISLQTVREATPEHLVVV
jgi:uncharacterized protein